jgi:hypothetical protein
VTSVLDQSLAWLGEEGAFAKPLEKRNSKSLLELMHLMSNGGLAQVQGLCRSREAPALGHLDECLELIETNATHDHKTRLSFPSK